ncbi:MAG: cyclase family protein [Gammaproteobacteria bacterium]
MTDKPLPAYDELPVTPGAPPGSSWGVWGAQDQLGTLNLLNDARTLEAVRLVRRGAVFPLGLPLHEPDPHLVWRTPPRHRILHVGHEARGMQPGGADDTGPGHVDRDDYLDGLWLQGSSQWDGLTHIRHPRWGNYNGVPDADIHGGPGTKLGVDQWAARAIVGRGVLLDIPAYMRDAGRPYDPKGSHAITGADLDAAARRQGVQVQSGDILLLHTGWMQCYLQADREERARMVEPGKGRAPGLECARRSLEYVWNLHVAAIAADTMGVEVAGPEYSFELHQDLLPLLGIPLGEYWVLDALARDCAADGQYAFLLVSVPLNVRGGVGSPPQAVAIK